MPKFQIQPTKSAAECAIEAFEVVVYGKSSNRPYHPLRQWDGSTRKKYNYKDSDGFNRALACYFAAKCGSVPAQELNKLNQKELLKRGRSLFQDKYGQHVAGNSSKRPAYYDVCLELYNGIGLHV